MQYDLQDKCGVVGIYSKNNTINVSKWIYSGLYTLQHRGQESAGISVFDDGKTYTYTDMGLVADVFGNSILETLTGNIGIGHVRYSTTGESLIENSQPFIEKAEDITIAMAHNGDLVNSEILREELKKEGYVFKSTTDSEVICHLILNEYRKNKDIIQSIKNVSIKLIGSYSLVLLVNDTLIAIRDPLAIKPLIIGSNDEFFMVASESVAFDPLDLKYDRSVKAGEIVTINKKEGIKTYNLPVKEDHCANCMFEYLYFARPDSIINDKNMYNIRLNVGKKLSEQYKVDADVVMPVPDSAIPATLAYSRATNIPYAEGLIKNRYVGRTFIMPTQEDRDIAVKVKMNTVESEIKGKKVILIDDSIVRGTTSTTIIKMLRKAGVKEVHLLIGCPEIIAPCYYGIAMASKKELIAVGKTNAEIRDEIGVDSLGYLSLENLIDAIGTPEKDLCTGCLTEKYPTLIPSELKENK